MKREVRLSVLMRRTPTQSLIDGLRAINASGLTRELGRVRAWTITELENRYPAAGEAVQAAFEAHHAALKAGIADPEPDYAEILIGTIPAPLVDTLIAV